MQFDLSRCRLLTSTKKFGGSEYSFMLQAPPTLKPVAGYIQHVERTATANARRGLGAHQCLLHFDKMLVVHSMGIQANQRCRQRSFTAHPDTSRVPLCSASPAGDELIRLVRVYRQVDPSRSVAVSPGRLGLVERFVSGIEEAGWGVIRVWSRGTHSNTDRHHG